jgi:hypothetical protein
MGLVDGKVALVSGAGADRDARTPYGSRPRGRPGWRSSTAQQWSEMIDITSPGTSSSRAR